MRNWLFVVIGFGLCSESFNASAVTKKQKKATGYITHYKEFVTGLHLPLVDRKIQIKPLKKTLRLRVRKSLKDDRVEPIFIQVPRDRDKLLHLVKKLAKPGRSRQLLFAFNNVLNRSDPNAAFVKHPLSPKQAVMVNFGSIAQDLAKFHHEVVLDGRQLRKNKSLTKNMFRQLKIFLSKKDRRRIKKKIRSGRDILLEKELLPRFPRKMARRYIAFRGPNCFQAALAFHSRKVTYSSLVNVKEEEGYHRSMINYDELWRAINRHFYEVDPRRSSLKYGDMLVFFSVPEGSGSDDVYFRWIRHTATYLFNDYTFSKGSKSPNTPYSIKTLAEEWRTWQRYSPHLGVKVFRRAKQRISVAPPLDLTDWVY